MSDLRREETKATARAASPATSRGKSLDGVFRILDVLRDIMQGGSHSRHTVAARGGVSLVTADRWMRVLRVAVPGCQLLKVGKTTWLVHECACTPKARARRVS